MKEAVNSYLNHAHDALDAANVLLANEHVLALANRAYYAVFYCICALLLTEGITTKKHEGARVKFHELFVKTGKFEREAGAILERSLEARQSADYDMDTYITEEQARKLLEDARYFYSITVTYFQKNPIS
ncbi:HEPN domain-containing protein [Spirosoma knui]